MSDRSGASARPVRLARLLLGSNQLRRSSDRLEGLIVMLLSAVFAAAVAAAPWFGARLYLTQIAGATRLRPAVAVLTQSGPSDSWMNNIGEATARWLAPDGRPEKGLLTTMTAPSITGARAGARVPVWLSGSGQPQVPPVSAAETMFSSVVLTVGAVGGAAIALLICYALCRVALDRRRLAAWTSEWSQIGPRWTTRR
jgi:hypothetical protein